MTLIGLISDTHECIPAIARAVQIFKAHSPDLIVHCGDIISPPILERFAGLPMRFIFGNNDGERLGLRKKAEELGFGEIDDTLEFSLANKNFIAYHGTNPRHLESLIESGRFDYIFHGHTHIIRDEKIKNTRVLNPGALFSAELLSIALLDVESDHFKIIEIQS